jgi:(E)-4-hydroxy-3-methylbut-2-enyl-diphosphate synthase
MEEALFLKELQGGYCNSLNQYSRFLTREVQIGDVPMGGLNPIRIQSMTTTDTMDTAATVAQTIRMVESGCEYVRITAPSMKSSATGDTRFRWLPIYTLRRTPRRLLRGS